MSKRPPYLYACDFETVVSENPNEQKETAVWSAAYSQLFGDNTNFYHNIDDFMVWLFKQPDKSVFYFHNLKFDGFFILDWLLNNDYEFQHVRKLSEMPDRCFDCVISGDNRFYTITIKEHGFLYFIWDSLKLLPFRLEQIGKAFNTPHKKLKMEYKGNRYPNCKITADEAAYIINDVLCLKEALEIMRIQDFTKLTIGNNCMNDYKKRIRKQFQFRNVFIDLKAFRIDETKYGYKYADDYIRKSYRGGWCYLKPEYENHWLDCKGKVFDVNSLYPSVMHSDSGNRYPVGMPHFWKGDFIPDEALKDDMLYFVRCRIIGKLKKGYLPTIQVKDNYLYRPTVWIENTDIWYNGKYHPYYFDTDGIMKRAELTLTLTKPDLELLKTHYNLKKFEVLDGCYFETRTGYFDEYINHWFKVKTESKDKVHRTIAKLLLNNLYGKFATNDDSSYMIPALDDEGVVTLTFQDEHAKDTVNIAVGTMVTAYARYFTITHAQKNYDRFIYADTDSLHCLDDGKAFNDIVEDDKALLTWKNECDWTRAKFIRQKTYCEFVRTEDGTKVKPYWNIKCAGMPESCKRRFLDTHPINDFDYGLSVSGKLTPKKIKGGIVLTENDYTLHEIKEKSLKKWLAKYK